jgi:hypothetical protein
VLDQCREELEILDEEFRRTAKVFTCMTEVWKIIGDWKAEEKTVSLRVACGYFGYLPTNRLKCIRNWLCFPTKTGQQDASMLKID